MSAPSPHSGQAIDAARAQAEADRIRGLVRPHDHVFTRAEIGAMAPDEFTANEDAMRRQIAGGLVK